MLEPSKDFDVILYKNAYDHRLNRGFAFAEFISHHSQYPMAPAKLDFICKRYMWAPPVYKYQKNCNGSGNEIWTGKVELPYVGLPLLTVPRHIGPLVTAPCFSMQQAQVEAAESALNYMKMLRADMIQRSTLTRMQPVYPPILQPMQSCIGYPYQPVYPSPSPMQVTGPAIWRSV